MRQQTVPRSSYAELHLTLSAWRFQLVPDSCENANACVRIISKRPREGTNDERRDYGADEMQSPEQCAAESVHIRLTVY